MRLLERQEPNLTRTRLTCLDSLRGWSEAGSTLECSREVSVIAEAPGASISPEKSFCLRFRPNIGLLAILHFTCLGLSRLKRYSIRPSWIGI
jgi:hypothetical protein